jgi:hypothetical protein
MFTPLAAMQIDTKGGVSDTHPWPTDHLGVTHRPELMPQGITYRWEIAHRFPLSMPSARKKQAADPGSPGKNARSS